MGSFYGSREDAVAAAVEGALTLAEPGDPPCIITACRCGRGDLYDMDDAAMREAMGSCDECERLILAAPGRA